MAAVVKVRFDDFQLVNFVVSFVFKSDEVD